MIKDPKEAMEASKKHRAELEARAENLRLKASEIQAENSKAKDQAVTDEVKSTEKYAAVLGAGDMKAEKAALGELQRAQSESAPVKSRVEASSVIIAALEAEVESLERQAEIAKAEEERHKQEMLGATAVLLGAQWNEMASALADIGAKIVSVRRKTWHVCDGLQWLHLPTFGPDASPIKRDDLYVIVDRQNSDQLIGTEAV